MDEQPLHEQPLHDSDHLVPDVPSLVPFSGRDLRYAVLIVLERRFGLPRTIPQMLDDLAVLGISPTGGRPNKVLADAMRWEVQRGRVERVGHGRYRLGRLPETTRWRARRTVREALASNRATSAGLHSAGDPPHDAA